MDVDKCIGIHSSTSSLFRQCFAWRFKKQLSWERYEFLAEPVFSNRLPLWSTCASSHSQASILIRHPRHVCEASRRSVCWELSLKRFAISLHCMNPTKWPASCSTATPWHLMKHDLYTVCAAVSTLYRFSQWRYMISRGSVAGHSFIRFEGSTASLVRGSRRYAQFWAVFFAELSPMKATAALWSGLRGYGIAE